MLTLFEHWAIKTCLALVLGYIGYAIASIVGFPAPSLTGPAMLVSIGSLSGAKLDIHPWLRNCAFLLIGITMGTGVTPEVLEVVLQWPASFVMLGLCLIAIFLMCRYTLEHIWKLDYQTATLSSTPGHMSYILSLALNSGGDIATIGVIQSIRILALTLLVPVVVTLMGYHGSVMAVEVPEMTPVEILLLTTAALACALLFHQIRLAAAFLLAGMAVSSLAHITGLSTGDLPDKVTLSAILIMGTIIGTRFSGVRWAVLRNAVLGGLAVTVIAMALSSVAAILFSKWSGLPLGQILIAFSPGGVEAMVAMALILDADPTFVSVHHVWRLLVLTILVPVMLRRAN